MNPEPLVLDHLRAGRLVALKPDQPFDVPLFWQQSRIVSPVLGHVTSAVVHVARTMLVPFRVDDKVRSLDNWNG
jgi:LysR family transcriptional regulator (chromosome initiation inhibitor)